MCRALKDECQFVQESRLSGRKAFQPKCAQRQDEENSLVHSGNSERLVEVPVAGVRQEVKVIGGRGQCQKALNATPKRLDFV